MLTVTNMLPQLACMQLTTPMQLCTWQLQAYCYCTPAWYCLQASPCFQDAGTDAVRPMSEAADFLTNDNYVAC